MPTQAEMKVKLCPFMSSAGVMIKCAGDECNAFNSRPARIMLAKEGGETTHWGKSLRLTDPAGVPKPHPEDLPDDTEEIERILAEGWTREGTGRGIHFTKEGPPDCWCDAMPANMECIGGGQ